MVIFSALLTAFGRLMGAVATMTVVWATILLFGRVPQSVSRRLAFADAYLTTAKESEQVEHEAGVPSATGPAGTS